MAGKYQVYAVSAAGKRPVFETWRNQRPFTNKKKAEQAARHWQRAANAAGSEVSYVVEETPCS